MDDQPRSYPKDVNPKDEADSSPQDAPTHDTDDDKKTPSFVRTHPLLLVLIAVVAVIGALAGYFVWLVFFHPYESTDDAFVDARSFALAAKVSGYVADVPVTDNQHVNAGDVIVRIDPRDYQIALDQAKGQVDVEKAAIVTSDAQIAAGAAAVDQAKAQQESASASLQYARDEAARQQQLLKSGSGSEQAAQQAASTLREGEASLAQAQASVQSAEKNKAATEAQKSSAIASLHQAEAQVETAEQNLKYTTISAAQPGRVVRLSGAKGQYLQAGQAVSMFVPDDVWITANFKETQLADMRPGQPVQITIDAYPGLSLAGRVDSVQPGSGTAFSLLPAENATGNYVKVTQRVPVKIVVDTWPAGLTVGPGMSVVPVVTVRPRH